MSNILAIDSETTGLFYNNNNPCRKGDTYYQSISWGLIAVNEQTLEELDSLYVEIKWNGVSEWSMGAEKVHGLSKVFLAENGLEEEEAVVEICLFIQKHFPNKKAIKLLGHNVATFDLVFLRDLMARYQIHLPLHNRHIDTFSSSFTMFDCKDSNEMCDMLGIIRTGNHNALIDARMALTATQRMRELTKECILKKP